MTVKITNAQPYLLSSRKFPQDPQTLETELSKSYIETANCVNQREIALYALSPTITGQQWYTSGSPERQQTLRQIYSFKDGALTIPHNVKNFVGITRVYGTFVDSTDPNVRKWYPLPYVSATAVTDQVTVWVTSENIVITKGGTAPAIVSGTVVLEWLSAA